MSEHAPRVRIHTEQGVLLMREGLSISFYLRHSHREIAQRVMDALASYLRAVGTRVLGWYDNGEGEWKKLDEAGWEFVRRVMLEGSHASIILLDMESNERRYRFGFEYYGRPLEDSAQVDEATAGCAVSFWLPTEFMEEHGPERVRDLALELAEPLPFCSGHAGLSFNGEAEPLGMTGEARELCFRYPGLDIPDLEWLSLKLGTRVRGAYWLTFLGQPVLGELGGPTGLRSRLFSPDTVVQQMEGERVMVSLGKWPEAGDIAQGEVLPAYRELARVLEPRLYFEQHITRPEFMARDRRRWERRFLD